VNLKVGQVGYITQALGGSFTVYIDGNLFRIPGSEADGIGMTVARPGSAARRVGGRHQEHHLAAAQDLLRPGDPVNIVDLGLIYACEVHKNEDATRTVDIKMTLTAPGLRHG
jgi:hypothetical protein